jgi:hypothetical protein
MFRPLISHFTYIAIDHLHNTKSATPQMFIDKYWQAKNEKVYFRLPAKKSM